MKLLLAKRKAATGARTTVLVGICLLSCGCFCLAAAMVWAQQPESPDKAAPIPRADFMQAADEVLAQMSQLLSLPVLQPLKKSLRSREQIRDYLVKSMRDDKQEKQEADQKTLEALGLIPKGYPLEQEMLTLLTEQVAGMYDPKGREFFIADWTSPADQRVIMAHELTHALQDQHFHIQKWQDAVKNNDDAGLARDAVLEGSATVAMFDYLLRGTGKSSMDIADLDPSLLLGSASDSPELSKAPQILQDELLFPYLPGTTFVQRLLKAWGGWPQIHKVFENPPASTQQILHPDLYLEGVAPVAVSLPPLAKIVPRGWKKLDENILGEFGVNEVLKQFLGGERADALASYWTGDRYAIFEHSPGGQTLLVIRLRLANDEDAAQFFAGYSEALERKDKDGTDRLEQPSSLSYQTADGGVYLRCLRSECLSAQGTTRELFEAMTKAMGWPPESFTPSSPASKGVETRLRSPYRPSSLDASATPPAGWPACSSRPAVPCPSLPSR